LTTAAAPDDRLDRRRAEILEAAFDVLAEKGYRDAGVADIAERLGIGHGTFYRYFESKRDVFEHVVRDAMARLAGVVADEDPSATDTIEAYREQSIRIGHKILRLFSEDRALARIFFHEAVAVDDELTELVYGAHDAFAEFTASYLRNGRDKGFLRADLDPEVTARAINGMIFAAVAQLARPGGRPFDGEGWIAAIVSLMFDGVRN
jgi:AcrR family transcriptional regulator